MPEPSLQTAFEIKTQCDEISRQLLRWHWEQRPGSHTFEDLLQHIQQRREESPDYYDRLPDLSGKTSWQQLDTTLCMRVLLDPSRKRPVPWTCWGRRRTPRRRPGVPCGAQCPVPKPPTLAARRMPEESGLHLRRCDRLSGRSVPGCRFYRGGADPVCPGSAAVSYRGAGTCAPQAQHQQ